MAVHYILDGYNIMNKVSALTAGRLEDGRNGLLRMIETRRPQGSARNRITVVFDGQPDQGGGSGPDGGSAARVVFSAGSADDHIKRMVDESRHAKSIVVVSDDNAIRCYVRAAGAGLMSVAEFLARMAPRLPAGPAQTKGPKRISATAQYTITREMERVWLGKRKTNTS